MKDKRGQGLSTNAIILIVLGVVVLAVMVIGFTLGWDKIAPWISTSNVDTIVTQCNVACSTNSVDSFCNLERDLKGASIPDGKYTCNDLIGKGIGVDSCSISCTPAIDEQKTYVWVEKIGDCDEANERQVSASLCDSSIKGEQDTICCEISNS